MTTTATTKQIKELAKELVRANRAMNEAIRLHDQIRSTLLELCQSEDIEHEVYGAIVDGVRCTLDLTVAPSIRDVPRNDLVVNRIGQKAFQAIATVSQTALKPYLGTAEIKSICESVEGNVNVTVKVK